MDHKYQILKLEALKSRLYLICLQYVGNILIPDHSPDVFHFVGSKEHYNIVDKTIFHFFRGFLRWDAQYFMHISIHGYTYENTVAFFPLFPVSVGVLSKVLHTFIPYISIEAVILLVYVLFNIIIFQLATISLYKLTCLIFNNAEVGYKAGLLFCYNPASIFFIAPYSESLFSLLTFRIMFKCLELYKNYENNSKLILYGQIIIETGLSTLTRSNGILNIGFIIFVLICQTIKTFPSNSLVSKLLHVLNYLSKAFLISILSLFPFIMYQIYCYRRFCHNFAITLSSNIVEYSTNHQYILPYSLCF